MAQIDKHRMDDYVTRAKSAGIVYHCPYCDAAATRSRPPPGGFPILQSNFVRPGGAIVIDFHCNNCRRRWVDWWSHGSLQLREVGYKSGLEI